MLGARDPGPSGAQLVVCVQMYEAPLEAREGQSQIRIQQKRIQQGMCAPRLSDSPKTDEETRSACLMVVL